jgi:hypothetical protein
MPPQLGTAQPTKVIPRDSRWSRLLGGGNEAAVPKKAPQATFFQ